MGVPFLRVLLPVLFPVLSPITVDRNARLRACVRACVGECVLWAPSVQYVQYVQRAGGRAQNEHRFSESEGWGPIIVIDSLDNQLKPEGKLQGKPEKQKQRWERFSSASETTGLTAPGRRQRTMLLDLSSDES